MVGKDGSVIENNSVTPQTTEAGRVTAASALVSCVLTKVGMRVQQNVVGKEVVETMSPEFVGFIQNAHRSLRYGRK